MIKYTNQELETIKEYLKEFYERNSPDQISFFRRAKYDYLENIDKIKSIAKFQRVLKRSRLEAINGTSTTAYIILFELPFENIPLYINYEEELIKDLIHLRLKFNK